MKPLRYLKNIELCNANKVKQTNGSLISEYNKIKDYKAIFQEIIDEASISIYGATVNKMYRISSPMQELENYLKPKISNKQDNISLYYIKYNNSYYKISTVREKWLDIEYKE